jgi:hypothetical protein
MPRNQSAGSKRLLADLDDGEGADGVVQTTVAAGAQAGLVRSSHCLIPFFKKAADVTGVYVWAASLYANEYVMKQLDANANAPIGLEPLELAALRLSRRWADGDGLPPVGRRPTAADACAAAARRLQHDPCVEPRAGG